MITIDGNWVMEGLERTDKNCIKNSRELSDFVDQVGFLPLFKNMIEGFSVEEMTATSSWWGSEPEEDPWLWREVIAEEGRIAYGKLFSNRAGFVSKEWYPILASYRRDGYDFDSRYEDGLASRRAKNIMDVLELYEALPSNEIRRLAGFGKGGEKGFEGVMASLQMQTYITVKNFQKRINKQQEEYGWPIAVYTLSEKLFGEEYVHSAYYLSQEEAKAKIVAKIGSHFSKTDISLIEKIIK